VERLQAAMLSGGAHDREVPFEDVVDNDLAEQAVAGDASSYNVIVF